MRYLFWFICLLALLGGGLFGALNSQQVAIDLYFYQGQFALGGALLLALLLGALLAGGLLGLWVIWPLRLRLRRLNRSSTTALATVVDDDGAA